MSNNNHVFANVLDLTIYDEDGKLVTEVNSLKDSNIYVSDEGGNAFLVATDVFLNTELLRFQEGESKACANDFENMMNQIKQKPIIFNKNNKNKRCKLIAKTKIKSKQEEETYAFFEIPLAAIVSRFNLDITIHKISEFDILFEIFPDDNGELFRLHNIYKGRW